MRTNSARVLTSGILLAIFMANAPLVASADPVDPPSEVSTAEEIAREQAIQSGEPVEVTAATTQHSRVLANPDGTFTAQSSREAVRVNDGSEWRLIDTTVVQGDDGRFRAAAAVLPASFSPGGTDSLASLTAESGSVDVSVQFVLPVPRAEGNTLVYEEVLPGVDLRIDVFAESFSQVFVVKNAEAAANPELASIGVNVTATNLGVSVAEDGSLSVTDSEGEVVFGSPKPTMWDSSEESEAGPATSATDPGSNPIPLELQVTENRPPGLRGVAQRAQGLPGNSIDLQLIPPTGGLIGPDVDYPVFIDPSFGALRWDYATQWRYAGIEYNSGSEIKVGYCGWAGCPSPYQPARGYFNMDISHIMPVHNGQRANVLSAALYGTQNWNAASYSTPVNLHWAGAISSGMGWPGTSGNLLQQINTSGSGPVSFSNDALKWWIQDGVNNGWARMGFALIAPNEGDNTQWKKFSAQWTMEVTYSYPTATPPKTTVSGACGVDSWVANNRPTFIVENPSNSANQNLPLQAWFRVSNEAGAIVADSGWFSGAGSKFSWTPPVALADAKYRVTTWARTVDYSGNPVPGTDSAESAASWFTVDTTPPAAPNVTNSSFEGTTSPSRIDAAGFLLDARGERSVMGYAYAFDTDPFPTYSWTRQGICAVVPYDRVNGFESTYLGKAMTIPFPWDKPNAHRITVRAIDRAGNMSAPTVYNFATGTLGADSKVVEAENLTMTGGQVSPINDATFSAMQARLVSVNDGDTITFPVTVQNVSALWQTRYAFTPHSDGVRIIPKVNGLPFDDYDPDLGGMSEFSFTIEPGKYSQVTPDFSQLGNPGLAQLTSFTLGLQVSCPEDQSTCQFGLDKIEMLRVEPGRVLQPIPDDAIRLEDGSFLATWESGTSITGLALGASTVSLSVDGTVVSTVSATSEGNYLFTGPAALSNGGNHSVVITAKTGSVGKSISVTTTPWLTNTEIRNRWVAESHVWMGIPTSQVRTVNGGYVQDFTKGTIYSSAEGAYSVYAGFNSYYHNHINGLSALGFPLTDETTQGPGQTLQHFQRGTLYWDNGQLSVTYKS